MTMGRLRVAFAATLVVGLACAPSALAKPVRSSNWAGYAIHRTGLRFRTVTGSWTQPSATCVPGAPSFSSDWVGLGGYRKTSQALEQIGTEVDCSAGGRVVSNAWFELVPSSSHRIHMRVAPGDRVTASVTVVGDLVTVRLTDGTTGRVFKRTLHASQIDTSSAEWIVEAPSECAGVSNCHALPLANFGSATFSGARAVTRSGHRGGVSDRAWGTTRITLSATARLLISSPGGDGRATAVASQLADRGSSFTVTYVASGATVPTPAALS